MLSLLGNQLFERFPNARTLIQYSTKGISKWGEEITPQIKKDIEKHWRPVIASRTSESTTKPKYYTLSMFPYPSGHLHMGHVRVYSISDTISRFHRMNGKDVIHPMGWDAFGLPAENAALERKIQPQTWTKSNIDKMKSQLFDLGCQFDWEREINTSDPNYYKWTQYLFLELFKAGMVYKKEAYVNWDPIDETVLADEQVDVNGCSWRSGAKVEKKLLSQWFIRTTKFAKSLYDGLEDPSLIDWRDIVSMQQHWIGECNGISIDFQLFRDGDEHYGQKITVWTNKPEKFMYPSFIAVQPGSQLDTQHLVCDVFKNYKHLSISAECPITKKRVPIIVTNEVLYAEGSDFYIGSSEIDESDELFLSNTKIPHVKTNEFKLLSDNIEELKKQVCDIAMKKNVGGFPVSSKLKDWLISRQRYWGTPIPVIYCDTCGTKPVTIQDLPVVLPEINHPNKCNKNTLLKVDSWIDTVCPDCGGKATRETDTMDTFVDSSWYFLRYLDPNNCDAIYDKDKVWKHFPVDLYIGGKEHAVLHLYYARFMSHFLYSIGKLPEKEPFKRLLVQGMVMGKAFMIKDSGRYVPESNVKIIDEKKGKAVTINDNKPVEIIWEKMSKSKYNGVDPSHMFEEYGCDSTRLFMLADVAPTSFRHWSSATFPGILNWQRRLWLTVGEFIEKRNNKVDENKLNTLLRSNEFIEQEKNIWDSLNYFVSSTTFNFNFTYQLSVAISRLQGLTNILRRVPGDFIAHSKHFEIALAYQIIMLAPLAPHFASELWSGMLSARGRLNLNNELIHWQNDVLQQNWPVVDKNYKLDLIYKVTEFKESFGVTSLSWPGNSPDLNPIENLWAIMKQKIVEKRAKNTQELIKIINHVWEHEISLDIINNLYLLMSNKIS